MQLIILYISVMEAQILQTEKKSGRIKIRIPYQAKEWRVELKKIQSVFYHPAQKLWSIPNTKINRLRLDTIFGPLLKVIPSNPVSALPKVILSANAQSQLDAMHKKLILGGMSKSTISAYISVLIRYVAHYDGRDLATINTKEIEDYVYNLKMKYNISNTKQNVIINAIKYYYEKVLGLPRTYYEITRPKKEKTLPNVLSTEEVYRLIMQPTNIKHKCILHLLYSGGLRTGEISNLRIQDIKSADKQIFIKSAKGKKDRVTLLAKNTLALLREYYIKHKPSYWLFEGADGGKYSSSSIQKVFRQAALGSGICAWATPRTLRHSFATHLLQENVNLRYIQSLLGHVSSETTQIYTHLIKVNNDIVKSPLDRMMERRSNQ